MPETQLATPTAFNALKDFLSRDEFKAQIALALPKHLTADRMLRVALTAALHQPKIAEVVMTAAGKASLMKALLTASQLGLEVDGRQGHLVPFNDKRLGMILQFIPGYQGLVQTAYNHPKVKSIWWAVVHEQDEFIYEDGLDRKLLHRRYSGPGEPGPLTHAYAVCEMDGHAKTFVCLNRREVEKAKQSSRGASSEYSPWVTHEGAMWAKTAVRALSKQIPQSNELRAALQADDDIEISLDDVRFSAAKPANAIEFGDPLPPPPQPPNGDPPAEEKKTRGRPKKTEEKPAAPALATALQGLRNLMIASHIEDAPLLVHLFSEGLVEQGDTIDALPESKIRIVVDNWINIVAAIQKEA